MSKSRILGADMTLLLSLRFLIKKMRGVKAAGRFYKSCILNRVFLSFLGQIIHTIRTVGAGGNLFRGCLRRRFLIVGYCSVSINSLGGAIE